MTPAQLKRAASTAAAATAASMGGVNVQQPRSHPESPHSVTLGPHTPLHKQKQRHRHQPPVPSTPAATAAASARRTPHAEVTQLSWQGGGGHGESPFWGADDSASDEQWGGPHSRPHSTRGPDSLMGPSPRGQQQMQQQVQSGVTTTRPSSYEQQQRSSSGVSNLRSSSNDNLVLWAWDAVSALLWPPLHNTPTGRFRRLAATTTMLAVLAVADLILCAITIAGLLNRNVYSVMLLVAVAPLSMPLTPLIGLLAVAFRSTALLRVYASIVQISLLPCAVAFLLCEALLQPLDFRLGSVFPLVLLCVKLATLPAINARIATLDLQHDADRWTFAPVVYVRDLKVARHEVAVGGGT